MEKYRINKQKIYVLHKHKIFLFLVPRQQVMLLVMGHQLLRRLWMVIDVILVAPLRHGLTTSGPQTSVACSYREARRLGLGSKHHSHSMSNNVLTPKVFFFHVSLLPCLTLFYLFIINRCLSLSNFPNNFTSHQSTVSF